MKRAKRFAALALALALALSLAGCGAMEDVSRTLVQGNLDEIYLGKYSDEFLELVDITADEAEANYLQWLQTEAEFFTYYFDITYPTEELTNELVELYKEIYSNSRYEVGESTKVDDTTYGVQLTIYHIDIMQKVVDQSEPVITELNNQTFDTYEAYDAAWAEAFIQLCRDNLDSVGYLDPVEMVVQVKRDDNNVWTIYEDDFQDIDLAMIHYPS